jgi:hypothetical protein
MKQAQHDVQISEIDEDDEDYTEYYKCQYGCCQGRIEARKDDTGQVDWTQVYKYGCMSDDEEQNKN